MDHGYQSKLPEVSIGGEVAFMQFLYDSMANSRNCL